MLILKYYLKGAKFDKNSKVNQANFTHARDLTKKSIEKLKHGKAYVDSSFVITNDNLRKIVKTFCREMKKSKQWYQKYYKLLLNIQNLDQLLRNYQPNKRFLQNDFERLLYQNISIIINDDICHEFDSNDNDYKQNLIEWINYKLRTTTKLHTIQSQRKVWKNYRQLENDIDDDFILSIESYEGGESLTSIDSMILALQENRQKYDQ